MDTEEIEQIILPNSNEFFDLLKEIKSLLPDSNYRVGDDYYILTYPKNGNTAKLMEAFEKIFYYKLKH
ncbi:hypothetical protein ACJRO0_06230 [Acetobacter oryzifermentans]|uniref:hypothetical protein n=1 Tax=Acetobacter oryzifermentans TaxID=1633874 RepID=UPI0039BF0218